MYLKERIIRILVFLLGLVMALQYAPALVLADEMAGNEDADSTPPVLTGLEISANRISASGSLEILAEARDDLSGVDWIVVNFFCKETGKSLTARLEGTYREEESFELVPYPDGKYHGMIYADQHQESGIFVLSSVGLYDKSGNRKHYFANTLPEGIPVLQFELLESHKADSTPPVLLELQISSNEMMIPGSVEVTAAASDDISGIQCVIVNFFCEETGSSLSVSLEGAYLKNDAWIPYPDGKYHGTLTADRQQKAGRYVLSGVSVYDEAGNHVHYFTATLPEGIQVLELELLETPAAVIRGNCGEEMTWEFEKSTGILTINGTGAMADYDHILANGVPEDAAPWYYYEVKKAVISDGVTHIGKNTFRDQTHMNAVEIPGSVTSIGDSAFQGCRDLTTIRFLGNAPQFLHSEQLAPVAYPFYGITATVYYPGDNATWTEDMMRDYGGNLIWVAEVQGDLNMDGAADGEDAMYLIWHALFPDLYPISVAGDVNGDGKVDDADAVVLLWHTLFPKDHPL